MLYGAVAAAVVLVHFSFLAFVAGGSMMARRWPRVAWLHLPAVGWSVISITIGVRCPLTDLEQHFRVRAGNAPRREGFVDHYVEGVLYPEALTPVVLAAVMVLVVVGYARLAHRASRHAQIASPERHWS